MRVLLRPLPAQLGIDLSRAVRRRVLLALASFTPQISSVAVHMFPRPTLVNERPGCRLKVRLKGGRQVTVEEWDADALLAVDRAVQRAQRWTRRQQLAAPLAGNPPSLGSNTPFQVAPNPP